MARRSEMDKAKSSTSEIHLFDSCRYQEVMLDSVESRRTPAQATYTVRRCFSGRVFQAWGCGRAPDESALERA